MDTTKGLNDVCVFCYKNVEENVQLGNIDRSQTVDKFCKFLRRICGKRLKVSGSPDQLLATCEACVSIMDSFNELYHQVQCLQLQMERRLDEMKNVMKLADKVPSRVKAFRGRYAIFSLTQPDGDLHGEHYEHLLEIRNVIQLQMTEYLSKVFPQVCLENYFPKSVHSNLKEHELHPAGPVLHASHPQLQSDTNPFLEWLKTVIAVTMCCFPIFSYHHNELKIDPDHLEDSLETDCLPDFDVYSRSESLVHRCPELVSSPSYSLLEFFTDGVTNFPVPTPKMEEYDEQINDDDNKSTHNIVHLDSQVTVPTQNQNLETQDSLTKIIFITEPEQLKPQSESLEQHSVENSDDGTSELENDIPSTSTPRQLRPKFKCKSCSLSFSTLTRLSEHSKSCTNDESNDSNESEDDDDGKQDIKSTFSDDDSNYDMSSQASERELKEESPMEEDSGSDYSNEEEIEDIKPNTKQVTFTKPCEQLIDQSSGVNNKTKRLRKGKSHIKKSPSSTFTPRSCPKCDKKCFKNQYNFDRHLKTHEKYVCKQCKTQCKSPSLLAIHMLSHSEPESWPFTCVVCDRKCQSKKDLARHKETHPNTTPCPISLNDCLDTYKNTNGKMGLSQENIETLKLSGADIRLKYIEFSLQSCDLPGCKPGLYSSADLEYHRKLHGQFQCFFCEYNSSFATNLIEHESEHCSNLENGLCPRCPEVNVDAVNYKKHFVEHHLETRVNYRCAQCPVCSKLFPQTDQVPLSHFVNEHDISRLNDPEKVFGCDADNCSAYFLTAKQLVGHSKSAHDVTKKISQSGKVVETLFACDVCPLKFVNLSKLKLHKKSNHREPPNEGNNEASNLVMSNANFPCLVASCRHKFLTKEDQNAHLKLHGNFKCEFCPVTESFAPDLALHEVRMHSKSKASMSGQASFNCSRCEFSSKGRDTYIRHHLEKHLNLSPDSFTLKCQICNQSFNIVFLRTDHVIKSLRSHFRTNHDKSGIKDPAELFNCAHCPAYFLARNQLHLHNQRIHPEHFPNLSLSCDNCHRQFQERWLVLAHRTKVHHNHDESGYEFICQVDNCNKRYEYACDLERHIALHNSYTPKPCPECGKVLMNQQYYDVHVKCHQGHVCEQCGKVFKSKTQLTVHMLYHADPDSWQFMCDICSRKCPSKDKLAEHKKVHSKTKPYVCETCGAAYAHRHNWRHHMIKIHGVPDFTQKRAKPTNLTSRKGIKNHQNVPSKRRKRV